MSMSNENDSKTGEATCSRYVNILVSFLPQNRISHPKLCTAVGKNGNVDNLMPGTLRESMALLTEAYDKWDLIGMNFPNDLQNRRVANDDRLPHFPYRDDGKLLWEAIETWVDSFVSGFYKTDGDVANDLELQVRRNDLVTIFCFGHI